ncbi:hypothetical protein GTU99_12775 [Streptomyces sp. PRKS01-65]|nr:hypothetical protein [Streptomyces harenosi]NEY33054.1 hypothetical protein [Streptomyces harenosi]
MTDQTTASIEERVARHLASKDWLVEADRVWERRGKKFHEDYLALAREVIAMVQAGQEPATDRAALRDRIAEALISWTYRGQEPDPETGILETVRANAYSRADAVLAVLPATADRAAVPSPPIRKTLRRWAYAAGHIESELDGAVDRMYELVAQDVLRRMADEAQPAEAHPAEHTWAAELYDPVAKEWVPGTRYPDRDRAVNHLNHAAKIGPAWKDGTPTQRRLVRATTTYTIEQPAAGARQDEAQP